MRIDAYQKVNQIYQTVNTKQVKKAAASSERDQVQISTMGRDYQTAKKAVADSPDIREDKISVLKSKMEAGTYQVSSEDFASKLLEKYNELR